MNIPKQKEIHRYREQTSGYRWEERREEGQPRGGGVGGKTTECQTGSGVDYTT